MCHPCRIKYDYILHVDNLTKEVNHILRRLNIAKLPSWFILAGMNSAGGKQSYRRKEALETLPESTYHKIIERYRDDFELFNFTIPSYHELTHSFYE